VFSRFGLNELDSWDLARHTTSQTKRSQFKSPGWRKWSCLGKISSQGAATNSPSMTESRRRSDTQTTIGHDLVARQDRGALLTRWPADAKLLHSIN
jgi:hypothetical protein